MMTGFLGIVIPFTLAKGRMNGPVVRAQITWSGYTSVRNFNKFKKHEKAIEGNLL